MGKKLSKILSVLIFAIIISFSCLSYGVEPENGSIPERRKSELEKILEEKELERKGNAKRKYTKEYEEYLKLSDEEKAEFEVIPPMYEYTIEEYYEDKAIREKKFQKENDSGEAIVEETVIPSYFNLRDKISIPTDNQGPFGLCWAFASTNALETYLALNENKDFNFSEMHTYYLSSKELSDELGEYYGNIGLMEGAWFRTFEEYTDNERGPVSESKVSYRLHDKSEFERLVSYKPEAYVLDYVNFPNIHYLADSEKDNIKNDIKKHIMTNGGLYAHIDAKFYLNPLEGYMHLNEKEKPVSEQTAHAVTIIGWDDNYSKNNFHINHRPETDGAFIALNSWGDDWSNNGIFYISYEDYYVWTGLNGIAKAQTEPVSDKTIKFEDVNVYNCIANYYANSIRSKNDSTLEITFKGLKFEQIEYIYLYGDIENLSGIEEFTSLKTISFDFCDKLNLDSDILSKIPNLSAIYIYESEVSSFEFLKELKLKNLSIDNCNFDDLSLLENMTSLESFAIYLNDNISLVGNEIDFGNFTNLKSISISGNCDISIKNIPDDLEQLQFINIRLDDWSILQNKKIDTIYLECTNLIDFDILSTLTNSKLIYYRTLEKINDKLDLSNLTVLESLYIHMEDIDSQLKIENIPDIITDIAFKNIQFDLNELSDKLNLESIDFTNMSIPNLDFLNDDIELYSVFLDNTNTTNIDKLLNYDNHIWIDFISNRFLDNYKEFSKKENLILTMRECYKEIYVDELIFPGENFQITIDENLEQFLKDNKYDLESGWMYTEEKGCILDSGAGVIHVIAPEIAGQKRATLLFNYNWGTDYDNLENNVIYYEIYYDVEDKDTYTDPYARVKYSTHIENVGDQAYRTENALSGTVGKGFRLEGIKIDLDSNIEGAGIEYATHVQNIGWQNYVGDNELSGTSGMGLRLEGIKIRLTEALAEYYDVYYRVHIQNTGWLGWAKNGEEAGSSGYGFRLEGIQIVLVEKGKNPPDMVPKANSNKCFQEKINLVYQTHIEYIGWQDWKRNGETSGVKATNVSTSLRIEGLKVRVDASTSKGDIVYSTHVENIGWTDEVSNGEYSGTTGQALRVEGLTVRLTGELEQKYDVYYRIFVEGESDWQGWAKNGEESGSVGLGKKLQGLQIVLKTKGSNPPAGTNRPACLTK